MMNVVPVVLDAGASADPRFIPFKSLPEDEFEAMLSAPILCAGNVVGVINVQHRLSYQHSDQEVRLMSLVGFLVGAEIERARLEAENQQLSERLESRKAVDRAKGVLQKLGIVRPGPEADAVSATLNAAGLTYVAALVGTILNFAYYFMLLSGRRN